jgi:hypothetical protein
VRYASVYHRFEDADAFRAQIEQLGQKQRQDPATGQMSLLPAQGRGTPKKQ